MMAGAGCVILMVFGLACWLTPNPSGFGTHQQLGLPECSFRQLTGLSCPHCGMTTSLCLLVRGQLALALRANPSGIVLGGLLLLLLPWCFAVSLKGRWLVTNDPMSHLIQGLLGYLAISGLFWLARL